MDFTDIVRLNPLEKNIFVTLLVELKVEQMIILPEKCMDVLERNVEGRLTPCVEPNSLKAALKAAAEKRGPTAAVKDDSKIMDTVRNSEVILRLMLAHLRYA